jgi:hypothetical protein
MLINQGVDGTAEKIWVGEFLTKQNSEANRRDSIQYSSTPL